MGKRYYCDYCEKSFPYNTQNRKKHNEGSYHQMMKNSYYTKFKDLTTIIEEELQKKPCFKFFNSGYCHFGSQCRCSHKTPSEIQYLKDLHQLERHKKAVKELSNKPEVKKKRHKTQVGEFKLLSEHLNREDQELLEKFMPKFEMPNSLKSFEQSSLPLSLVPPTYKDFLDYSINTWK